MSGPTDRLDAHGNYLFTGMGGSLIPVPRPRFDDRVSRILDFAQREYEAATEDPELRAALYRLIDALERIGLPERGR